MARRSQGVTWRRREFLDPFAAASQNVLRAAEQLDAMLRDYPEKASLARDILICEQEGDRITREIIQRLNETDAHPVDRDDVFALATGLDDIVDYAEEVADYLGIYKIEAPMEQAQVLAGILLQAASQVAAALAGLRDSSDISSQLVEINRLENEGDRVSRGAMASLFDGGVDPLVILRWKDLFERLEAAIDATENVANVLEGIVVKNS